MSSASICRPRVYELEHDMVIDQYPTLADTLQTGVPMISAFVDGPPCDAPVRYHVNMYPNGSVARYQGHSSVFVHLTCRRDAVDGDRSTEMEEEDKETTRHCHMRFATLDQFGGESFSRTATHPLVYDWAITDDEKQDKNNWGYRRFCPSDDLIARCHPDGRLHLRVQLTICVGARITSVAMPAQPSPCAILHALRTHMAEEHFTDLTLRGSDGSEQRVHKVMLAANSRPLHDMFTFGSSAASLDVEMEGGALSALVGLMYKGQCPTDTPLTTMLHVLSFCHKYSMSMVTIAAQTHIDRHIALDNSIKLYRGLFSVQLPHETRAHLQTSVVMVMSRDWPYISESDTYRHLVVDAPSEAICLAGDIVSCVQGVPLCTLPPCHLTVRTSARQTPVTGQDTSANKTFEELSAAGEIIGEQLEAPAALGVQALPPLDGAQPQHLAPHLPLHHVNFDLDDDTMQSDSDEGN